MPSKPTDLTRWATAGGADVVEPASGTKDSGYVDAAAPDAGELNWILNRTYLWEVWLNAFESTAHTWSAAQTFSSAVVCNGGTTIGVGTSLLVNGTLDVGGVTNIGNDMNMPGGTFALDGQLIATYHAIFTARLECQSTFDVAGASSFGLASFAHAATFNGGIVAASAVDFHNAVSFFNTAPATFNGLSNFVGVPTFYQPLVWDSGIVLNPAKTAPIANKAMGLNTVKAWARFKYVNGSNPTFIDGANVASIVINGLVLDVTFAAPMLDNNYAVVPSAGATIYIPGVTAYLTSGTGFKLGTVYVTGFGSVSASQDPNSALNNVEVTFYVMGRQ